MLPTLCSVGLRAPVWGTQPWGALLLSLCQTLLEALQPDERQHGL